jgi:Cu(I)/Ag(I) efflux system membrane fusion protein
MKAVFEKLLALFSSIKGAGVVLLPLLLVGMFLAGWWIGRPAKKSASTAAEADSGTIWTCSMHPSVRQPGPGLCPICEMELIPVSAEGAGGLREIKLTADAAARLDVRVAPVRRQPAVAQLEFLGRVAADETLVLTTTARMAGRLDKLFVDYTGTTVRKGYHIAEIYSPDLYVAQVTLRQAKQDFAKNPTATRKAFYQAEREKLRLLGISSEQIDAMEEQSEPTDHVTLNAPQDGVVLKLHKRQGDYVKTGEAIYSLADLSTVWVFLEAYEGDLPWLKYAQDVEFHAEALPGKTFTGKIAFMDRIVDEARRIARIRVNVPNPDEALKPGMFVRGTVSSVLSGDRVFNSALAGKWISPMHPEIIKDGPGKCDKCGMDLVPAKELGYTAEAEDIEPPLLVPTPAVLRTGDRAVVYRRIVSKKDPVFEGREIVLGPRAGDYFIVESGLREGDLVVTRGAFKLDSELQVRAKTAMMLDGQGIGEASALSAPATVAGGWQPVLRTLARARRDLADSAKFQSHLEHARHIVVAIQPEFLADDYKPLWDEASMQLENIFAKTRMDAENKNPAIAWETLIRDLPKATALAGLDWQIPELQRLPSDQLAQVMAAIEAYLPVTAHLAGDKPEEALTAAEKLAAALEQVSIPEVASTSTAMKSATDEASLRQAVKVATEALQVVIRSGGDDQLGHLYLVHCPMAFKGAGADWFSSEAKVENPYFGSRMFSCGDITETLSLPPGMKPGMKMKPGEDHSKHQHEDHSKHKK